MSELVFEEPSFLEKLKNRARFFYERVIVPLYLMATLIGTLMYLMTRFTIAVPSQEVRCVDHSYFIIDKFDKEIVRGEYFAFRAKNMEPFFDESWTVVKLAAGVAGDQLYVGEDKTVVHGREFDGLSQRIVGKVNKTIPDLSRSETIPFGKVFALGTLPRTFDSKYWGYVDAEKQVIGRAYGIW